MQGKAFSGFKRFLTYLGTKLSPAAIYRCEAMVNHLKLGLWLRQHNFRFPQIFTTRDQVFRSIAERVRDQRVLYLEFGVFQGAAIRLWSQELKHPEARLHGFDSFEGLPDDFGPFRRGAFDTAGQVPQIDDSRVQFFKGWFHETLPHYTVPEHDVLIINIDADLYASTIYVLRHLRPYIKAGTYLYFDDMALPDHEGKAFSEFMSETGLKFQPLAADRSLSCQFYQCLGYEPGKEKSAEPAP